MLLEDDADTARDQHPRRRSARRDGVSRSEEHQPVTIPDRLGGAYSPTPDALARTIESSWSSSPGDLLELVEALADGE